MWLCRYAWYVFCGERCHDISLALLHQSPTFISRFQLCSINCYHHHHHHYYHHHFTSEKVSTFVIAAPNDRSPWNFQRLVSVTVSIKYASRNFDIGDPRSGQICDLLILSQWEKIEIGSSFGQKPLEVLSNIGLQVRVIPWIGILRTVAPPHVTKVISGHEKSPAVFRQ